MNDNRIYDAIVLNDYPGEHFATWVDELKKTIETRGKSFNGFPRDLIICCGQKSVTANAGKALCLITFSKPRPMQSFDEVKACISVGPGRIAYDLYNRRGFNRKFSFSKCRVSGAFQSIFQIRLPDDIKIIPAS